MRAGTAETPRGPVPVIERDGALLPIGDGATPLETLIATGDPLEPAPGAAPLEGARLLAPLRPGKIVAIGLNYLDHIKEAGLEPPAQPPVFAKFTTSLIADGDAIRVDRAVTQRVDWEVELAVVIGREAVHLRGRRARARLRLHRRQRRLGARRPVRRRPVGARQVARHLLPARPGDRHRRRDRRPAGAAAAHARQRRARAGLQHQRDAGRRRRPDLVLLAQLHRSRPAT